MNKPTSNISECKICKKIIYNKGYYKRKTCSRECFIKNNKGGNYIKGKTLEEIHGKEKAHKIKSKIKKRNAFCKGKTLEEIHGKEKAQKIRKKISKKLKGISTSETTKKKISLSKKGWKHPNKGKTWEELYGKEKATQMKINFNKLMKGKYFKPKTKFIYNDKYYRSNWEIAFVKFCEQNRIQYIYEPQKFIFDNISYIPDFYLPNWDMWVEIKGFWDDKSLLKCKLFEENISKRLWKIDETNCGFMISKYREKYIPVNFDNYIEEEWVAGNGC